MEVADQLIDGIGDSCDLLMLFGSYHHRAAFSDGASYIRHSIDASVTLGTTGEAVLGGDEELDGGAGLTAIALNLGEAKLKTWTTTPDDPFRLKQPAMMRERLGFDDEFRVGILLADPFSCPVPRLVPALSGCGEGKPVPLVGGVASGSTQPGMNVLVLDDQVTSVGGIGVSISGDIDVDFVVSQGCRPIGKPLVVTKAKDNLMLELGSRPAYEVLQELGQGLSEHEKHLLRSGLLVGSVINEYKPRFGRGDFLIRNVLGFDQRTKGIAVADRARVGQTIQFHVRDKDTAAEDLQLLLDAQQLSTPPFGGLLFTCNGRGERLFGEPSHDISMIHDRLGNMPVAGFFAAGELGPIGDGSFLHGHTASLALFRSRQSGAG